MKISTELIKFINQHYGSAGDPAPNGVDELVKTIGAQLAAVEEVIPFGERFEGVVIAKVVSSEDHPNADRLHVCKVDDGGKTPDVTRDENGLVQVVCGAPNVRPGILVAWLPPGATVPSTVGSEPFVLDARDIRGVTSNGMMASPKELGLSDYHDGILEIDEYEGVAPGVLFVDAYHLKGDTVIDMENKMFTHRPDCFGYLGLARELEGIQNRPYKSPEWYTMNPEIPAVETDELPLEVRNELPELVPRFVAIALRDVEVKPSPVWLQVDLARAGLRPINNIVDYTNFYMLETGQPLHAYDYDKVKARSSGDKATIVVRHPKQGEKMLLLNGKEIEPRAAAVMIATDTELIGVGGVMGGGDTEVDENTKNIIIECANFDMYSIRRTAMEHGLFTDAVTRFNKGQSPLQNLAVVGKIVAEIRAFAGGKVASPLIDDNHLSQEVMERGSVHPAVTVTTDFINQRLGWNLSAEEMSTLLGNVEFKVAVDGDSLTVTAPFWRTDIEIPEDVVEEIGRLNGYDKLPLDLPMRNLTPAQRNPIIELKYKVRNILAAAGANELLTYSFVHGNLLDRVEQDRERAFQVGNALSPDLQYYRLSVTPGLLEKIHSNIKAGHPELALFEIGKVHIKDVIDDEGLPRELERLAFVFAADGKAAEVRAGAPYYQARTYLTHLLHALGVADKVTFEPLDPADSDIATPYYDAGRAATLRIGDKVLGRIGEYKASVRSGLKLPAFTAGFELGLDLLLQEATALPYTMLPRFPKVEQDICLKVSAEVPYGQVFDFVAGHLDKQRPDQTHHTLSPVDIYQRPDDQDHKQITLRLSIASYERTLTDDEVNQLLNSVAEAAKEQLHAERV
jgi:phenylalanyl-tRNA synthetase beta chain